MYKTIISLSLGWWLMLSPVISGSANHHPENEKLHSVFKFQSSTEVLRVENKIVTLQVAANDRPNYPKTDRIRYKGIFNLGTTNNQQTLIFKFPEEPWSSHTNVKIDNQIYSNDPIRTQSQLLPIVADPTLVENTIRCIWRVQNVTIEQRLTPEQFSDTTGAVNIQYHIRNDDSVPHQVGLLLELDTMINQNDTAAVATNYGFSRQEQKFVAPDIPDFFQAYESGPVLPGLIAQGTLKGGQAVPPDVFMVGDWTNLSNVRWDYTPVDAWYEDSAVLLRWDEKPLAPGETRIIGTYYGIGAVSRKPGQLSLNASGPDALHYVANQLHPNPFFLNLLVTNTGFADALDVTGAIYLPPGLNLGPNETRTKGVDLTNNNRLAPDSSRLISWQVLADIPEHDQIFKVTFQVTSSNTDSNSISRSVSVPAPFQLQLEPKIHTIFVGEHTSFQVSILTATGFNAKIELDQKGVPEPSDHKFDPAQIDLAQTTTSKLLIQTKPATPTGVFPIGITAATEGFTLTDSVTLILRPHPDFKLRVTPELQPVQVGQSTQFQVFIDTLWGFNQPITLNLFDPPATISHDFNPPIIDIQLTNNSTLTIKTEANTPIADYALIITGTAPDSTIRADTVILRLRHQPDFILKVEPPSQSVVAGESTQFQVSIDTLWEFNQPITLKLLNSSAMLRPRFNPPVIDIRLTKDATLTIETDANTPIADYALIITGMAPDSTTRADTVILRLRHQPDFILKVEPPSQIVVAGESTQFQVSIDTLWGFNGRVQLSVTGLPALVQPEFDLPEIDAASISNLLIQTDERLPAGSYPFTVIGQSGRLNKTVTATLIVLGHIDDVHPNPFTPNGDGYNDGVTFDIGGLRENDGKVEIYNFRGRKVRELSGEKHWDGKNDAGEELPSGLYLYIVKIAGAVKAKGTLTLVR